jgi:acetyl-CoA synthetase
MVHTTAGYMVYTAYTLKNVFNYEENDIFGVRLILVGLQVILIFCMALIERSNNSDFEVPSYPDFSRFWKLSRNIK